MTDASQTNQSTFLGDIFSQFQEALQGNGVDEAGLREQFKERVLMCLHGATLSTDDGTQINLDLSADNQANGQLLSDLLLDGAVPVGVVPGNTLQGVNASGKIDVTNQSTRHFLETQLPNIFHNEIAYGRISPNQADERLAKLNLPPLHAMPTLSDFHDAVKKEPYWTLQMAVAWIAWRNIDDVVKQHWPYAQHGGHWRDSMGPNQTQMGAVWERTEEPKLSDLMFFEAAENYHDNAPLHFIKESREQLWRELQANNLQAIGVEGGGSNQLIASHRWASLAIQPVLNGREYIGAGQYGDTEKIYHVKLQSKDVLRLWPLVCEAEKSTHAIHYSQVALPEYIAAWLELETARANESLVLAFEKLGRQKAAAGKYRSGNHIVELIDTFKATILQFADKCFQHAQTEKMDYNSIEALTLRVTSVAQSAKQKLETQIAKVERQPAKRTQDEITSRPSKAIDELEKVCKITVLRAKSSVSSVAKSTQIEKSPSNGTVVAESDEHLNTLPTLSEAELVSKYKDRTNNWPVGLTPPSREDDEAFLRSISQQVNRTMARKIRHDNAPEAWTDKGRRPTSKSAS